MDYEPNDNADRVSRRQDLTRDAGATRRQIRATVLGHLQRVEDRIDRRAASITPEETRERAFRPVITETVVTAAAPIMLASAPAGNPPSSPGLPSGGSTNFPTTPGDWVWRVVSGPDGAWVNIVADVDTCDDAVKAYRPGS